MGILLLVFGICSLALGWILVYRPSWILYLNKIAREILFNDAEMLLERRKKGILFVLLSVIFLAVGYDQLSYRSSRVITRIVSTDRMLYKSLQHLYNRQYQKSESLCEKVLSHEPENARALYHLGAARFLMGERSDGAVCWQKALNLNPNSPEAEQLKKLVRHEKGHLAVFTQ